MGFGDWKTMMSSKKSKATPNLYETNSGLRDLTAAKDPSQGFTHFGSSIQTVPSLEYNSVTSLGFLEFE